MDFVFFGLSITSSWGNGHASTYRGLLRALHRRGHRLTFFERNVEWYASNRDLPEATFAAIRPYADWAEVRDAAFAAVHDADAVIVGSFFPDAIRLLDAALGHTRAQVCFYDIDTPITVQGLRAGRCSYLRADQIPALDLYLSFAGGPLLDDVRNLWGARRAAPLYCSCEPNVVQQAGNRPAAQEVDLSYMGTFTPDRQAKLRRLFMTPAQRLPEARFRIAGPLFPDVGDWPRNVGYQYHLSPREHCSFYRSSRFTLNLTRQAMAEAGYSPSVRLFEAAACGVPIITDHWPGMSDFFDPGTEILTASNADEVVEYVTNFSPAHRDLIAAAAWNRLRDQHTPAHRALTLERYLGELS